MQLENIDKTRYRKHLNMTIIGFIVSFLVLAVVLGQALIMLFSSPDNDNFWFNFSGVGIAFVLILSIINLFKAHPFFTEVLYVWNLKQQINYIFRKLKKVKHAAYEQDNVEAMTILLFYYEACYQLYNLDDNTITLSSLVKEKNALESFIDERNLTIVVSHYQQSLITNI